MGSLGYILGGAMQGIGGALAAQTQEQNRNRHEMALENLRQANQREQIQLQGDMQDRNASRSDDRADRNDARGVARRTTATMATDTHRAGITRDENNQKFEQQVTLTRIENQNAQNMERLRSTLRRGDAEYERALTAGDVVDTMEGSDGFYWFRTRDGQTRRSQVPVAPRASAGTSILEDARGNRPTTAATTAPARPAAPPAAPAPARPATNTVRSNYTVPRFSGSPRIGTVEDGFRFKGGDPSNPNNWERAR